MDTSVWSLAWHEPEHAENFSAFPRRYSQRALIQQCRRFNEGKLLETLAGRVACRTISDIGCGTGLFYPLLSRLWPAATYTGFDISAVVLERARAFHPRARFLLLEQTLRASPEAAAEVVFSRDVIHHQTDPLGFLSDLYHISQRYLVVRLRTREQGHTVYDPERSCQYAYGHWVPFIVVNTRELAEFLRSLSPPPARVVVRRHPVILGGYNGRFLPKELYEPATGTAETAVLVERGGAAGEPVVEIADDPEDHTPSLPYRLGRSVARALRL